MSKPVPLRPRRPKLIPLSEACESLGICRQTAYRMLERGEFPIPCDRFGRVYRCSRAALERYCDGAMPEKRAG